MAKRRSYRTGSVQQRGEVWWIQYYRGGKRYRESSHSTNRRDAENILRKRLGEIASGQFRGLAPERVKVSDLVELVLNDYRYQGHRSLKEVEWRVRKNILPAITATLVTRFGSDEIRRYVALRRGQKASDATINRELSVIRRGFTLGGQTDPPLVTSPPHIPKLAENNIRQGFLEHVQYAKLRGRLPVHLMALLVVGYHVGCRAGELRAVQWPQVDFDARQIRLSGDQTKAKAARTLPIYGEMEKWLKKQWEDHEKNWPDCPWVFHWNGKPIGSHMKGWSKACKAAGLDGLLFHDLRRSAVRNMERAGIPRNIAMAISGHKTEAVYRRYDIVAPGDLEVAAAKLERYFQNQKGATTNSKSKIRVRRAALRTSE